MRIATAAFVALLLISGQAMAAEIEGHIKSIDREALTITLEDGKSFKLPGEFDLDSLKEGMDVLLAYEEVGGVNQITDMDLPE